MPVSKRSWNTGVYCIRNTVNGKVYIGSASSEYGIKRRWLYHRRDLRAGKHHNRHLQYAWNKYGENAFEFSVLLYCQPDQCVVNEQLYIDKYSSTDPKYGYNLRSDARSNRGIKWSQQALENMRKGQRGWQRTDEHRAKLAEMCRERNIARKGKHATPEARKKMSLSQELRQAELRAALHDIPKDCPPPPKKLR